MKHILFTAIAALTLVVSGCKGKDEPQPDPEPTPTPTPTPVVTTITVDGAYADWETLIANKQAVQIALQSDLTYDKTYLASLSVFVDATDIYFMVNFDAKKTQPFNLFLGTKGENPTNAINLWDPCYVDYRIEFGKSDLFVTNPDDMDWTNWTYQQLMAYDHQKGGWSWTNLSQNMVTVSDKTDYNGLMAIEGKVARSNFEFTTSYFYIGAYIQDASMAYTGTQPAAEKIATEVITPEMLKVSLP